MKHILIILYLFLISCSDFGEEWRDGKYVIYWIDNPSNKVLGFDLGDGGYIKRIPSAIVQTGANKNYIAALSCSNNICSYYFIDRKKDHRSAGSSEFVSGPHTEEEYKTIKLTNTLPELHKF